MEYNQLKLNRFLQKQSVQNDETKTSQYNVLYPAPKRNSSMNSYKGRVPGNEEDDGAPNILTGTVITSCFIQTSALPSRVEIEGNNITFFDDTYEKNGEVIGDTSRLIFTHGSGVSADGVDEGFIMEKRASVFSTYDNVLSWYATSAREGNYNYMFIGRDGRSGTIENRNIGYMEISANASTTFPFDAERGSYNGVVGFNMFLDGLLSVASMKLIYAGTAVENATGIVAQSIGSGDGTASDIGGVGLAYYNETTGTYPYEFAINKTGFALAGLPTSSAGLPAGYLWNDLGTLKIV